MQILDETLYHAPIEMIRIIFQTVKGYRSIKDAKFAVEQAKANGRYEFSPNNVLVMHRDPLTRFDWYRIIHPLA